MTISQAENAKRLISGVASWAHGSISAHGLNCGASARTAKSAFDQVVSETTRVRSLVCSTEEVQVRVAYALGCWLKGFVATSDSIVGASKAQMESWASKLMELKPAVERSFEPIDVYFTTIDGTVKNIRDFSFMIPKNVVAEHKQKVNLIENGVE